MDFNPLFGQKALKAEIQKADYLLGIFKSLESLYDGTINDLQKRMETMDDLQLPLQELLKRQLAEEKVRITWLRLKMQFMEELKDELTVKLTNQVN